MNAQTPPHGSLGTARGTALYLGAILGPGVLALPGLAAQAAGPAALLAWVALLILSIPVAATFAALAARRPDAGGVATFTRAAFGDRAAAVCGWWFFSVIPVGASSAALVGAAYIADAAGLGRTAVTVIAALLLAIAFAANHIGLRLSGGAQLVLMGLLIALLAVACAAALPHFDPANLRPFAPHGVAGIFSAAAVLFYAFSGWEAASHLSGEFTDPTRQLRRVTALALLVVATVYLALATATAGVLGGSAAQSAVPLTDLLAYGFGPAAAPLTAVCAALLSLGAMNTFIAGASRLGAALARDGAMPAVLAKGHEPGRTPHRSLAVLAVLSGAAFAGATWFGLGLDVQMRATSAVLAGVTVLACAAAVRLLTGRARVRALVATACTAAIGTALSWYLLLPLGIAVLALVYLRTRRPLPRPVAVRQGACLAEVFGDVALMDRVDRRVRVGNVHNAFGADRLGPPQRVGGEHGRAHEGPRDAGGLQRAPVAEGATRPLASGLAGRARPDRTGASSRSRPGASAGAVRSRTMPDNAARLARLARAWDEAAAGYEAYFVPRFAPWVDLAVAALTDLPEGPILVPCCGTFPELDLLVERFPGREIVGIDLSPRMIDFARSRAAGRANVDAVVGDAQRLEARWGGRCAAVVSVFGLQQMPDPLAAVGSWLDALRPDGRLSVVFWPDITEDEGPFSLVAQVVRANLPAFDDSRWEEELAAAVTGHGAILERDELPAFPMAHASAAAYFDASARSGPLRSLALARGEVFMDRLRTEFLALAPSGEWRHDPHARLITARR